mmetsp:Transcript_74082/g.130750  ORF Transcript_74082/g.130750 Transcript_74082/m.130750 type:complete len:426 (-) Transcript_74082:4810-6087(-)
MRLRETVPQHVGGRGSEVDQTELGGGVADGFRVPILKVGRQGVEVHQGRRTGYHALRGVVGVRKQQRVDGPVPVEHRLEPFFGVEVVVLPPCDIQRHLVATVRPPQQLVPFTHREVVVHAPHDELELPQHGGQGLEVLLARAPALFDGQVQDRLPLFGVQGALHDGGEALQIVVQALGPLQHQPLDRLEPLGSQELRLAGLYGRAHEVPEHRLLEVPLEQRRIEGPDDCPHGVVDVATLLPDVMDEPHAVRRPDPDPAAVLVRFRAAATLAAQGQHPNGVVSPRIGIDNSLDLLVGPPRLLQQHSERLQITGEGTRMEDRVLVRVFQVDGLRCSSQKVLDDCNGARLADGQVQRRLLSGIQSQHRRPHLQKKLGHGPLPGLARKMQWRFALCATSGLDRDLVDLFAEVLAVLQPLYPLLSLGPCA